MFRTCLYRKPVPSTSSCKRCPCSKNCLITNIFPVISFWRKVKERYAGCYSILAVFSVWCNWGLQTWTFSGFTMNDSCRHYKICIFPIMKNHVNDLDVSKAEIMTQSSGWICFTTNSYEIKHAIILTCSSSEGVWLPSQILKWANALKNATFSLDTYHFNDIKAKNYFHWIWHPIIAWCIGKSRKVMFPYKMLSSIPHAIRVEFIHTVVRIVPLKWIHDGITVYLVAINLACNRKTSMKFRYCRANFSNSDVWRKKSI